MIERKWQRFVVTSGNPSCRLKTHLMTKNGKRSGSGTVVFLCAFIQHFLHQF
ncbi:hypothetical protein [Citrobacter freundii]|uniref:Uncharacterized protein n=1 Tax=Citrobacter freundii TaxID=546 RepID=A0A7G2IPZ1_CITFR|nr:hypothetical protein [Citrobacter freundii]